MLNSAWVRARRQVELPQVRVHDLKHTFGRRLRAAGIGFEDRSSRITTHYSAAELSKLIEAANSVCISDDRRPELVVLKGRFRETPANGLKGMGWKARMDANPLKGLVAEEGFEPPTHGL